MTDDIPVKVTKILIWGKMAKRSIGTYRVLGFFGFVFKGSLEK